MRISSDLSKICLYMGIAIFLISPLLNESSAQILTTPSIPKQLTSTKDVFRVSLILFGVDDKTGNVLSFVKVNNVTAGKFFNASKDDQLDHDGIVETVLNLP